MENKLFCLYCEPSRKTFQCGTVSWNVLINKTLGFGGIHLFCFQSGYCSLNIVVLTEFVVLSLVLFVSFTSQLSWARILEPLYDHGEVHVWSGEVTHAKCLYTWSCIWGIVLSSHGSFTYCFKNPRQCQFQYLYCSVYIYISTYLQVQQK